MKWIKIAMVLVALATPSLAGVIGSYGAPAEVALAQPAVVGGYAPAYAPAYTPAVAYAPVAPAAVAIQPVVEEQVIHVPKVFKHVYITSAPDDPVEVKVNKVQIAGGDKHVNEIYIETPKQVSHHQTDVVLPEQDEHQNVVYVLSKKAEQSASVNVVRPPSKPLIAPQVYFVRYAQQPQTKVVVPAAVPAVAAYQPAIAAVPAYKTVAAALPVAHHVPAVAHAALPVAHHVPAVAHAALPVAHHVPAVAHAALPFAHHVPAVAHTGIPVAHQVPTLQSSVLPAQFASFPQFAAAPAPVATAYGPPPY